MTRQPYLPDMVRIAELPDLDKRRLWAWMQANDPATVEQLQSPEHARLVTAFAGAPVLPRAYVERALGRAA